MSKHYREKNERSSVYLSLKETSLKSAKKYKSDGQVGYHRKLKGKNSVRSHERVINLKSHDYKANALSTELPFQMTYL